ncbi:hypothetical protein [Rhizohabitans arisaemae]|uniref:hypothetical protein n=1 Tax=Rhizohabitans arisaemae TaxID=2720610 RepID=UPI0024B0510B|nr:hypothetical protein [Rhizohabitans arisaemae]
MDFATFKRPAALLALLAALAVPALVGVGDAAGGDRVSTIGSEYEIDDVPYPVQSA